MTPRITNKYGLPEPLVRAVQWSDRDREGCDYTITELLRPPRIAQLERLHADEIEEDASDRLWMLLGSAGHEVLRRSADQKRIVEERCIVEVDGFKIGGQIDYSEADHMIWDYKFVSIYAAKEGPRDEWVQQLNCYRWLAKQYGVEIHKLQIVCIFRDWSKAKASRDQDYPQAQVKVLNIPMWDDDDVETFLCGRILKHMASKTGELPQCTAEEMWEKPEAWAVIKPGAKRATKLCYNLESAQQTSLKLNYDVEYRPAERPRCQSYCTVSKFCQQWADFQKANAT